MEGIKGVVALLVAALVAAAIGVGVWQFGWFVAEKNTDRQVNIDNRNKGAQVAWRDQAREGIRDFYATDDPAYRGALRNQVCGLTPKLTNTYRDSDIVAFESKECK